MLLHDGRTLIAWRSQTHGGRGEIGQSPIKSQSIRFFIPGTLRLVTWKDKATPDIGIANFDPVALHVKDKVPYLILHPDKCLSYNKWGRPNPPYILLKYKGGDWQQIPMAELPSEFVNVNLVISGNEKKLVSKWIVSHEQVTQFNSDLTQEYYHRIVREPLPESGMCEKRVLYRGAWILPNDPIARKFYDEIAKDKTKNN